MRKHSKVILLAEEQLVFGHSLPEMVVARDDLRSVPESLLLDMFDSRIARKRVEPRPPVSPWARELAPRLAGGASEASTSFTTARGVRRCWLLVNPIHEVTPEFRLPVLWASIDVS